MKLKAYKVEPENAESNFEETFLMMDEGRRFSVVSDDGAYSRAPEDGWAYWTQKKPEYWTDDLYTVWAALENYHAYCKEATGGADVYFYGGNNHYEPLNETAENEAADKEVLELLRRHFDAAAVDKNAAAVISILREHAGEEVLIPCGSYRRRKNWRDYAAELLTLLCGEPYEVCDIRGCSQGECAEVIMPAAEMDASEEIEARYFNTGDGWNIENESGDVEGYCYTWKWDKEEEQIREYVRDYFGDGAEVEIYDIEGYEPRRPIYRKRGEVAA